MSDAHMATGTTVPIEIIEDEQGTAYLAPARFELADDDNCLSAAVALSKASPHVVLFQRPQNFEWVNVTAREFIAEVKEVAKGLIALGVEQGDRVLLLSNTRYEWNLIDMAIWAAGASVVPIYPTASLHQIQWMVEDSGAVLAVTETRDHTDTIEHLLLQEDGTPKLAGSTSQLRRVIEINSAGIETLKFVGRGVDDEEVESRIKAIKPDDLASLNYTSGTTGNPKGCILTHRNWIFNVRAMLADEIGRAGHPGTRVVMYLPLAHVLAHAVSLCLIVAGATQMHWQDTSSLPTAFQRFRPHLVLGVPRVYEKVRNGAYNKAVDEGPIKGKIFLEAEKAAIEYSKATDTPKGPSRVLAFKHIFFDKLVYSQVRAALGGQVEYAITGGSAMGKELSHFYRGAGIEVYEGYGLTETAAACAVGAEDYRVGSIGQPMNGYGARINEDGEILISGGSLFQGYWHNPEATEEALKDGWFNTGDLGEITPDSGHIYITGRKKDLIVTAGGKNIAPAPLEAIICEHPMIDQALVVGDGKPFPAVLITLDEDELTRWKLDHNIPSNKTPKEVSQDPALSGEIQDAINMANATVSHAESIKKFAVLNRSLKESEDEVTATMKIKRHVVFKRFADEIDALYAR